MSNAQPITDSLDVEDAFHRAQALEAVLEWVLFQLLSMSPDPKAMLANFNSKMDERRLDLEEESNKVLVERNVNLYSRMRSAGYMIAEVQETLNNSVVLS